MQVFGVNQTLIAGFQMNFPAGTNMLIYTFDSAPPASFDDIPFEVSAAGLIENCDNAVMASLSYPTVRECQLTHRSTLVKSADLVNKYGGELVNVYNGASVESTSYADHLVYAPNKIINKGDYRDHKMFELCMFKQASDLNFAGAASFLTVSTDNQETIEFDYGREIEANCFGIKQGTAANTFMRQMEIQAFIGGVWTTLATSVLNVAGYQIVKFTETAAQRFRIRKLASGTAGTVTLAFAYFGKFGYEPGDVTYNMAVPQWAVIVPDYVTTAFMTNIKARLVDGFGYNPITTDDFCFLVSCSNLVGAGRLRFNPPVQSQNDFKFDYYLSFGQLF